MIRVLSERWPRPTLGWRTSADLWHARQPVVIDRAALREEVNERAGLLVAAGKPPLYAQRLAIEAALTQRGLLRIDTGAGAT